MSDRDRDRVSLPLFSADRPSFTSAHLGSKRVTANDARGRQREEVSVRVFLPLFKLTYVPPLHLSVS